MDYPGGLSRAGLSHDLEGLTGLRHDDIHAARQYHMVDVLIRRTYFATEDIVDIYPIACSIDILDAFGIEESDGYLIDAAVDIIAYFVRYRKTQTLREVNRSVFFLEFGRYMRVHCICQGDLWLDSVLVHLVIREIYFEGDPVIALVDISGDTVNDETVNLQVRPLDARLVIQQVVYYGR